MNLRRIVTFLASLTITAIFLVLALRQVDFASLARAFASADYRLVAIAALFTFTGYIFRTARWSRFLLPTKAIPISHLFPVLVVGFALNNLLPGRPGEFARAYGLGQREHLSKTLGFATVVVERIADGIALIAFLALTIGAFAPLRVELPDVVKTIALLTSLLFGVALAGLVFLLLRQDLVLSIFHRTARFLPQALAARLERMLGSFTFGLHSLRSGRDVVVITLLSLAVWASECTSYFLMLRAFNVLADEPLRIAAAAFMMVMINLGVMIPAAPGGLGPFEAAAVFALGAFGVRETSAAGVALGAHAVQYLLITGLGLFFVWKDGLSFAFSKPAATLDEE